MINGTKLLNVTGVSRGRRDGILKSEKLRHVIKIGPVHLKGVWIPFERALDFANKERITELLYPLFVHNIGELLYHPTNQGHSSAVSAAAKRWNQEQSQVRMQQDEVYNTEARPRPPGSGARYLFPTPATSISSVMSQTIENMDWGTNLSGEGNEPSEPPQQLFRTNPYPSGAERSLLPQENIFEPPSSSVSRDISPMLPTPTSLGWRTPTSPGRSKRVPTYICDICEPAKVRQKPHIENRLLTEI